MAARRSRVLLALSGNGLPPAAAPAAADLLDRGRAAERQGAAGHRGREPFHHPSHLGPLADHAGRGLRRGEPARDAVQARPTPPDPLTAQRSEMSMHGRLAAQRLLAALVALASGCGPRERAADHAVPSVPSVPSVEYVAMPGRMGLPVSAVVRVGP